MRAYVEFEILEGAYEISCPDALCAAQGALNTAEIAQLTSSSLLDKHQRYRLNRGKCWRLSTLSSSFKLHCILIIAHQSNNFINYCCVCVLIQYAYRLRKFVCMQATQRLINKKRRVNAVKRCVFFAPPILPGQLVHYTNYTHAHFHTNTHTETLNFVHMRISDIRRLNDNVNISYIIQITHTQSTWLSFPLLE